MNELIIWTYDWVPKGPRGFVRDLRLRWACEEAGRPYTVRTVAFDGGFAPAGFISRHGCSLPNGAGIWALARAEQEAGCKNPTLSFYPEV